MNSIEQVINSGPFQASWDSLQQYALPAWYEDGKFGIFIHWGVYAVPAFSNEWYPRNMYQQGTPEFEHHVATYGPHAKFGYKDFIPQFNAEQFNAEQWMELLKNSGAKFVVPVAEHHDGFALYNCTFSKWNAVNMGPKRDIIGELAAASRKYGLVFGVSYHRAEHWWFFDGGLKYDSDVTDPHYADFYGPPQPGPRNHEECHIFDWQPAPERTFLQNDWLARLVELVDTYQPQIVWFDWWINHVAFAPYLQKFAAYYYNRAVQWNKGVAINYKYNAYRPGTAVFDVERGQLAGIRPVFWQTDTSISKNSWGYVHNQNYKTATSLIGDLVDIVSKNGALLLNIGPRPDGTIPEQEQQILREIGQWLALNGEAIYGTRPWKVFGEGPTEISEGAFTDTNRTAFTGRDIRFTTKGDTLYAIVLAWPGKECAITSLGTSSSLWAGQIRDVALLGYNERLEWSRNAQGLTVKLPDQKPCEHAVVLKITQ
ncbi:alpha-L-fucosidase [Candidatus Moduliflexus flocculans]|uniref:alpha-L-fucosidase n=1 Tax=Candidatus Moduliflexus flocculans TaxID=1499966 RepID=A0A081BSZ3_9BACT|nr:alpha-L-fucosidase [Candidatus Moduliflexus flocculans]